MGKGGQLWDDDSALINAFDQAISNYKKMHVKGSTENSAAVTATGDGPTVVAAPHGNTSNPEAVDDGISNGSVVTVEVEESGELGTSKENEYTNSQVTEGHTLGSDNLAFQDQTQNYCSPSDVEEYNRLYNQYYEIEEQRQQILRKLHHFGSEHDPQYDESSGMQWGTTATTQEYQATTQMPTVVSGSATAGSLPGFPSAGEDLEKKVSVEDADIVKTALRAAERALSNLKEQTSDSNKDNKFCSTTEESEGSETDLGTVLNAWYSAGFYTGKYLTEKSLGKKQHD